MLGRKIVILFDYVSCGNGWLPLLFMENLSPNNISARCPLKAKAHSTVFLLFNENDTDLLLGEIIFGVFSNFHLYDVHFCQ